MFSCEYCETSKNNYFEEQNKAASEMTEMTEVIAQDFLSGKSLSKPSCLNNTTKMPVTFKPEL